MVPFRQYKFISRIFGTVCTLCGRAMHSQQQQHKPCCIYFVKYTQTIKNANQTFVRPVKERVRGKKMGAHQIDPMMYLILLIYE